MRRREEQLAELVRMFEAFGIEASGSRLDLYLEVLGDPAPDVLHDAVVRALREGGDFPPAPGVLHQHVLAIARLRRPIATVEALADGTTPEEQCVMRELSRRLAARERRGDLVHIRDYLRVRREIDEQLARDLVALAEASDRRRA